MNNVTLNNGIKMPILGYGVYQVDSKECERCVLDAIEVGYHSIDTAQTYGNEEGVGSAIKKSGLAREEFFITTKVWITNAGYDKAKASMEKSLRKLQTDYIDLLLIHQPFNDYYGTYHAMEDAYKEDKVKAIGVSNFYPDRLIDIATFSEIKPAINQIETHVFQQQKIARDYMAKYDVQVESWGPFAEGKNNYFKNPVLKAIGEKYDKTVAQTSLRFLIQNGVIVIPKSSRKERMAENFNLFDFSLTEEDMNIISALDTEKSLFFSHQDPLALNSLLKVGKVRALGASAMYGYQFNNMQLTAKENGWIPFTSMQNHYNLLYREDERELILICKQQNVALTPYSPLAAGQLSRLEWTTDTKRSQTDKTAISKYDSTQENDYAIVLRGQRASKEV